MSASRASNASNVSTGDRALRAMTDDGAFRAVVLRTTDAARGVARAQGVGGALAGQLAELVTGAVLIRETMAPDHRLQVALRGDGGSLLADSHPGGLVRALVQGRRGDAQRRVRGGGAATLTVARSLPAGRLHQGVVGVGAGDGVSAALMTYLAESEQVVSTLVVGSALDEEGVVTSAGGFIVQLLPEMGQGSLAVMSERLTDFADLDAWLRDGAADPHALLHELFYRMPHTLLQESDLRSGCVCDEARVLTALATLGRGEIGAMIARREPIELGCDYCGKAYVIGPERLAGLLEPS